MKDKLKKLTKNKKRLLLIILVVILIICLIFIKSVFIPRGGSKYGNRLDGIDKISFTKDDQNKVTKSLSENEKVSEAKMNIHGKIANVIFNVNDDVSVDDAKKIAEESLQNFSSEVKGFYDIQYIITKSTEKGTEKDVTNSDGTTTKTTVKEFPIMGYKNTKSESIVW